MSKFQIVKGITDNLSETPYTEGKVYFTYDNAESQNIAIYADIDGIRRKIKEGIQRDEINDFDKIYVGTSNDGWNLTSTQLSTSIPWAELKEYIQYSGDNNAGLVLRYINNLDVYTRTTFYLFNTSYNPSVSGSIYSISGIGKVNDKLVFISFLVNAKTDSINDDDSVTFTLTPIIDDIPTNVSDLNNDSGFQTSSEVNSAIATAIGNINQFNVTVISTLPTENIDDHTIYFMSNGGSDDSIYDEWMYINNNWEKIGTTAVDLSGYMQTSHPANGITSTDISNWNAKVSDDKTWNGVALDKTSGMGGSNIYVPYANSTNASKMNYWRVSQNPTGYAIAKYDDSSYLYSTTPSANDNSTKVATTAYVDAAIPDVSGYVSKSGDTMTGRLTLSYNNGTGGLRIYGLNETYTDIQDTGYSGDTANYIPILQFRSGKPNSSGSTTISRVYLQGIATPTSNDQAANKEYVDNKIPKVYSSTNTTGYLTMDTLPIYDGTVV